MVALVVVECVRQVGAVVELERLLVQKVLLLVCYICGGGLINCASKSAAGIAGCMVVAKDVRKLYMIRVITG